MTDSKDKRTGWLAELKVGSLVFIESNRGMSLAKVDNISPTGRININQATYDSCGDKIGHRGYDLHRLSAVTPDKLKLRAVSNAVSKLTNSVDTFRRSFHGTYLQDQALINMPEEDLAVILAAIGVFERNAHKKD